MAVAQRAVPATALTFRTGRQEHGQKGQFLGENAHGVTPSGSHRFGECLRGGRPAALPPATFLQPFRLPKTDDSVVAVNRQHDLLNTYGRGAASLTKRRGTDTPLRHRRVRSSPCDWSV